jgi:GNAT superfamily N-acetyltransferase
MAKVEVRDMQAEDERFVLTCTHVDDKSANRDFLIDRRRLWFSEMHRKGFRAKVALLDGKHAGFILLVPIEFSPAGPVGENLTTILCIFVDNNLKGKGVGRKLIAEAEQEAIRQGKRGLVAYGYYWDVWFMPAPFYEKCGFSVAQRMPLEEYQNQQSFYAPGEIAILWKPFDSSVKPPRFMKRSYTFEPVPGKLIVDVFFTRYCGDATFTVREVAREFGDRVIIREYDADDRDVREKYGIENGIYVNGSQIGLDYDDVKGGIRREIQKALDKM